MVAAEQSFSGPQWLSSWNLPRTTCNGDYQAYVVPLGQIHDGDDQDNADADKVAWAGTALIFICSAKAETSCTILRAEVAVKPSGSWL